MKKVVIAFIKYFIFWFFFLTAFKIFFVVFNYPAVSGLPASDIIGIFAYGSLMDLSVAGYLSLFAGLIFAIGFIYTPRLSSLLLKSYTLILLVILTFLGITDSGIYGPWGNRLNSQIITYMDTPGGIFASLDWLQITAFPVLLAGITGTSMYVFHRLFPRRNLEQMHLLWKEVPVILILTSALIVPIRGGVGKQALNHHRVYFSEHLVANQFACNFAWNFVYSIIQNRHGKVKLNYMSHEEASAILKAHDDSGSEMPQLIHLIEGKPTNVILVLLESFSDKVIEPLGGMPGVTPRLNEFCTEGIAFRSFYATGNRSDKGIAALIGGYPSDLSRTTMLTFPDERKRLDYFPKYFAEQQYNMSFYYGGDVDFYSLREVMQNSGIEKIVAEPDFPRELSSRQKWGVPDEFLYARLFQDLKKEKQPFFSMVYNISSHEPYDIENYNKFQGKSVEQKYLNVVSYTDSCLGVFIDSLRQSSIWENTLVIITADHASLQPGPTTLQDPDSYRIPLIFLGGVVRDHLISDRFGNHNDLGPAIISQFGWEHKPDLLSKDFLTDGNYAFYFRMEGWGFMSPEIGWFQNVETETVKFFYNSYSKEQADSVMHFAKAYVQYLHDDRLRN